MPDPARLLKTLERARACFNSTPIRRGRLVQVNTGNDLLVVGDLHGNVEHFKRILLRADLARNSGRHLVFQEVIHGPNCYPTGGDRSHQLLDLIAALKCQYPERIHLLPGNHELAQFTGQLIAKGDDDLAELFRTGVRTAYAPREEEILEAYENLFLSLPFALRTPNRVFLSHSLPSRQHLDRFSFAQLQKDDAEDTDEDWARKRETMHVLVWGRDTRAATAAAFLELVDADLLITGHIPCDEGYAVPNSRQLILDAQGIPGAYCLFPLDRPVTQEELISGIELL